MSVGPTDVAGPVSWLRLAGDEDGGGIPPSSSCLQTSSWESMGRVRTVVGSRHLALGANELVARCPHDCLPFATLPAFAVASGMAGMDVDEVAFMFVFRRSA